MDIPSEYAGREQTLLKHRVLKQYLQAWSHKLSSVRSKTNVVHLWYVDCFAGPWESQAEDRRDTSVAVGMDALEEALASTAPANVRVEAGALFVEANPRSAQNLRAYLDGRPRRGVTHQVLEGEFGARADELSRRIGADPAFVFVDPTGWKGAGMDHIAPVVAGRVRDVMVNVMFHHINRWKYDRRDFLRQQMREFFGLADADLPPDLDEVGLLRLYRQRLGERARLPHVADLAVPHPTKDQTFFRLVVGGHHPAVLDLFRDVEKRVVGREAGAVRERARARMKEERTGQLALGLTPDMDSRYRQMRDADLVSALGELRRLLGAQGAMTFGNIWHLLLADYHVTRTDLANAVLLAGDLAISQGQDRKRSVADRDVIALQCAL